MSVNNNFDKILIIPVAIVISIVSIIQALTWTIFSIITICCHYEFIVPDNRDTNTTNYGTTIYNLFISPSVIRIDGLLVNDQEFFIFSWIYFGLSLFWLIFSSLIFWQMQRDKWNYVKITFRIWSCITAVIFISDVVLTCFLGYDYNKQDLTLDDGTLEKTIILVSYGIVMTIVARGYVLLIFNAFFAGVMYYFTFDQIETNDTSRNSIINAYETSSSAFWFDINHTQPSKIAKEMMSIPRSRLNDEERNNSSPFIPDPDYTPPNTPSFLKSALKK